MVKKLNKTIKKKTQPKKKKAQDTKLCSFLGKITKIFSKYKTKVLGPKVKRNKK